MKRIIIIFALLLTFGCQKEGSNEVDSKVEATTEIVGDMELLEKMKENNEKGNYEVTVFDFEDTYEIRKNKPSEEEVDLYNEAIVEYAGKNTYEFYLRKYEFILTEYVSEDTINRVEQKFVDYKDSLKDPLVVSIQENDIDEMRKNLNQIEVFGDFKEKEELNAAYYLGRYLVAASTSDDEAYLGEFKGDLMIEVNPNYNQIFSKKIQEINNLYGSNEWERVYSSNNTSDESSYQTETKIEPFIGMTDEEALESSWGKPTKINTTINAYSTTEQWVYAGYKYLYFEDHYLVTIQK